jgi:8-oxo-dGTP diphosphatase
MTDSAPPPCLAVPRVGVGVLVMRDGRILIGERLGAHGAGHWALPGGHLEHGETVEDCARRELDEETGLVGGVLTRGPWVSDVFEAEGMHYVTIFIVVRDPVGEVVRREPAKCARWEWVPWEALPAPLFAPLASLRATGFTP